MPVYRSSTAPTFSADLASVGANLTQSGFTALDGITPVDGTRIFCKDQTVGSQNGIWIAHSGAWTRAPDYGGIDLVAQDIPPGHVVQVNQGNVTNSMEWMNTNTGVLIPGTTALTYKRIDGAWDEFETLYFGSALLAASAAAGNWLLRYDGGTPIISTAAMNGGTALFMLDPTQYGVTGKTIQLRLAAHVISNSTAPGITFTFGLYPVSSVAALVPTLAAASTTVAIATPALNTRSAAWGTSITMPAAGAYVLGCTTSGTNAAATQIIGCALQMRAI